MSETGVGYFYLDQTRERQGPFSAAEIGRLVSDGRVRRETLVWYAGLGDWRAAGDIAALAGLFAGAVPPPPPAAAFSGALAAGSPGALVADLPVWGLFWRVVLAMLGNLLIIPAPWTGTAVNRFICEHVSLPDGRRLVFSGRPGDIWLVFVASAAIGLLGQFVPYAGLVSLALAALFSAMILRWVCAKTSTGDGTVRIAFAGSYWGYVGWSLLLYVSVVSVIGWAWVIKFMVRWVCRSMTGSQRFDFVGTGWAILWRTMAFCLGGIVIIPFPWLLRWYTAWLISQVEVMRG
jgi:hypothetical protein